MFNVDHIRNEICEGLTVRQCGAHHYQIVSKHSGNALIDFWPTVNKFRDHRAEATTVATVGTSEQLIRLADDLSALDAVESRPPSKPIKQSRPVNEREEACEAQLAIYEHLLRMAVERLNLFGRDLDKALADEIRDVLGD